MTVCSAKALPFIVVTIRSMYPLPSKSSSSAIEYDCSPISTQSVQPVAEETKYTKPSADTSSNHQHVSSSSNFVLDTRS